MNNLIRAIAVLFCSLMSVSSWAAGDLYVSTSGSDSNPGTQSAPFRTISRASQAAGPGSTVHVAPGTYAGGFQTSASGTASARIRYVSDTKWGAKIVGSGSGYIWLNTGNYVTVDGFDLTGPSNAHGLISGPWDGGDVGYYFTATNNFIHDMAVNFCGQGGALTVFSLTGHSTITNNVIRNINAAQITHCATMQGIYISDVGSYVANNIVSGVAAVGISQWHGASNSTIVNNTVFNSYFGIEIASGDNGTLPGGSQNNYVANNISFNNLLYGIQEAGLTSKNTYVNNLSFGNPVNWSVSGAVSGTITANPMFVNYQANGSGDYHLQSGSPAIDKGVSTSAPSTDIEGHARPQGAGFDIGAYEYGSSAPAPSPSPTPTPTPTPVGLPALNVSMSSVNFGSVLVGAVSDVKVVVMKNTGTAPLAFTAAFSISSGFSGSGDCSTVTPLNPGESCSLNLKFSPTAVGPQSGSLIVSTNAAGSPLTIPLSGSGVSSAPPVSAPVLSVSADSVNFGSVLVGAVSDVIVVVMKNSGTAPLSFTEGFAMSSGFSGSGDCYTSTPLNPGASCSLNMKFSPASAGAQSGSLVIKTNDANSPKTVALSGTGLSAAPVGSVSASPTSLSFGRVRVGRSSSVQYVTITNTGKSIVTFSSAAVSGDFVFANLGTCGSSLAVGAKCTFSAKFVPKATGYRSGAITISTSASSTPIKIPLSGKGY